MRHLLENADVDDAVFQMQNPAGHQRGPLQDKCRHQHVETDATEAVPLQKRHQKTETDEYHYVDVLEDCIYNTTDHPPFSLRLSTQSRRSN